MTVEFRLRKIAPGDTERLIEVRALADNAFRGDSPIVEVDVERTRRYLTQSDAFGLVADADSEVAGFALAMDGRLNDGAGEVIAGLCHIAAVFVAPAFWNLRVGGRLLDALLDAARVRGHRRAQLWTQDHNEPALRLYRGRGFADVGREKFDERGDRITLFARDL
ncbi:MAG: GNAT family N-acetyltransferase [Rudaea sp.]